MSELEAILTDYRALIDAAQQPDAPTHIRYLFEHKRRRVHMCIKLCSEEQKETIAELAALQAQADTVNNNYPCPAQLDTWLVQVSAPLDKRTLEACEIIADTYEDIIDMANKHPVKDENTLARAIRMRDAALHWLDQTAKGESA